MSRLEVLKSVEQLFREADAVFESDKKLADHYVELARKQAMEVNLRLPSELKRRFCRHCYAYLKPGRNLSVRTKHNKLVYFCHECGHSWRMPL